MGFWFWIRWSKYTLPCVSHWMQPETLDRMHGVAIWGLWKINNSRWIGEEDQASKHHRTSGEFMTFSLWCPPSLDSKQLPDQKWASDGWKELQEQPLVGYEKQDQQQRQRGGGFPRGPKLTGGNFLSNWKSYSSARRGNFHHFLFLCPPTTWLRHECTHRKKVVVWGNKSPSSLAKGQKGQP